MTLLIGAEGSRIGDFPRFTSHQKKLEVLKDKVVHIKVCKDELYSYLKDIGIPKISIAGEGGEIPSIHYLQRDNDKEQIFFLVNHDQNKTFDGVVSIPKKGRLRRINVENGEIEDLDFESQDGCTKVRLQFYLCNPISYCLTSRSHKNRIEDINEDIKEKKIELGRDWDIEKVGYNSLTLDYCEYRIDRGPGRDQCL